MRFIYYVGFGMLGWYLGTQHEQRTRELYEKMKAQALQLKADLEDQVEENEALREGLGRHEK